MVKLYLKLLFIISFVLVTSNFTFGQKLSEKSRLNVGNTPKKTKFESTNNLIIKNNLPKALSLNTKPNYTQFYRDLLLGNNSKIVPVKTQSNGTTSENIVEKTARVEKISFSNIYPNPANEFATLDYKVYGNFNEASVTFFNILGKQIERIDINKSSEKIRINTSNWESGPYMYLVTIEGKKMSTKKLLVVHN